MSDDPVRLVDELAALTPDERRALDAGTRECSPVGAKAAIWGAVSLKLAAPATAAAASAATTTLALVKSAGLGLALGAVVGTGLYFGGRAETPPAAQRPLVLAGATSVPAPFHAAATTPARAAPSASETPPAPSAEPNAPHGENAHSERSRPAAPVESESQRVARARALLHAGDATRALETLGALARDEPDGLLAQEREALTIEALAAVGRSADARARAAAFLARYPASPHAAAVRRAAGDAP